MKKRIFLLLACGVLFALFLFGASAADHTLVYTVDGKDVYSDQIEAGTEPSLLDLLGADDTAPKHAEGALVVLQTDLTVSATIDVRYSVRLDLNGHSITGGSGYLFHPKGRIAGGTFVCQPDFYLYSSKPGATVRNVGTATIFGDDAASIYVGLTGKGGSTEYAQNITFFTRRMTYGYGSGFYFYGGTFVQLPSPSTGFFTFDSGGTVRKLDDCTVVMCSDAYPVFDTMKNSGSYSYNRTVFVGPSGLAIAPDTNSASFTFNDCSFAGFTAKGKLGTKAVTYGGTTYATDMSGVTRTGFVVATDAVGKTVTYTKADAAPGSLTMKKCFAEAAKTLTVIWQDGFDTAEYYLVGSTPEKAVAPYVKDGASFEPESDHWSFEMDGAPLAAPFTVTAAMIGKTVRAKMTYKSLAAAYAVNGVPVLVTDIVEGVNDLFTILGKTAEEAPELNNATITLLQDVTTNRVFWVRHSTTLDLNGHRIQTSDQYAFRVAAPAGTTADLFLYSGVPGAVIDHTAKATNDQYGTFFPDDRATLWIGYKNKVETHTAGNLTVYSTKFARGYGSGSLYAGVTFVDRGGYTDGLFKIDSAGIVHSLTDCRFFLASDDTVLFNCKTRSDTVPLTGCSFYGHAGSRLAMDDNKTVFSVSGCTFVDMKVKPTAGTAQIVYSDILFNAFDASDAFGTKVAAYGAKNLHTYKNADGEDVTVDLNGTFAAPADTMSVYWEGKDLTERYLIGIVPSHGDESGEPPYFDAGFVCTPNSWEFRLDGVPVVNVAALTAADLEGKTLHAVPGVSRVPAAFTVKVGDTVTGYPAGADETANGALLLSEIGKQTSDFKVTLYADVKLSSPIAPVNCGIRLDLNGHTVSSSGTVFKFAVTGRTFAVYSSVPGGVVSTTGMSELLFSDGTPKIVFGAYDGADGDNLTVYANLLYVGWTNGATADFLGGRYFLATDGSAPEYHIYGQGAIVTFRDAFLYSGASNAFFYKPADASNKNAPLTMRNVDFVATGKNFTLIGADTAKNAANELTDCRFRGLSALKNANISSVTLNATQTGTFLFDSADILTGTNKGSATVMRTARKVTYDVCGETLTVPYAYLLSPCAADGANASLRYAGKTLLTELWEIGQKPTLFYEKEGFIFFAASDTPLTEAATYDAQVKCGEGKILFYVDIRTALDDLFAIRNDGTVRSLTLDGVTYAIDGDLPKKTVDGVEYLLFTYSDVLPEDVLTPIAVKLTAALSDGTPIEISFSVSPIEYLEALAEDKTDTQTVRTVAALARYILALRDYFDLTTLSAERLEAIVSDSGVTFDREWTSPADLSSLAGQTGAIVSARVLLENAPRFAFRIADGYRGTVTVGDRSYSYEDFVSVGADKYVFTAVATCLFGKVTVGTSAYGDFPAASFTYTLDHYMTAMSEGHGEKIMPLLYALNDYVFETSFYRIGSEVVSKDGTKGTVTFVNDDGRHPTAEYMKSAIGKYDRLKISFALIANRIATLNTKNDPEGGKSFVFDENGKYVYTVNNTEYDYWRELLASCDGRAEVDPHSYTHAYAGENDDGGRFVYKTNYGSGPETTSAEMVKGSVTAEIIGADQVIGDLFADYKGYVFIRPGIGANQSEFFYDTLYGYEGLVGNRDTVSTVITADNVGGNAYRLPGEMTRLHQSVETSTRYIDSAIAKGGWAGFCIHYVHEDSADATVTDNQSIAQSTMDGIFAYAQAKAEAGDLWIATISEAAKYYNEWAVAKVDAVSRMDEELIVTLTVPDLSDLYDEALTVKVRVPESMKQTSFTDGVNTYTVQNDTKGAFLYVDVLPGQSVTLH